MTFFSKFYKKIYKDQLWECKKLEYGTSYHKQVIPFPVWSLICGHPVYSKRSDDFDSKSAQ